MANAYFVDHKRGELNELRGLLRNKKLDRQPKKKKEVLKKLLAYMSLGIDVSALFSDVVMATHTTDIVQKKMVYLYLCTYAMQKPDLAVLAINTLQRDGQSDDPMIRGLALRSLCSLRVPNLAEYVLDPIRAGLADKSSYVRKISVAGCAKLFRVDPHAVRSSDLVDVLYDMLKDNDTQVVANVINALNEVLEDEHGMSINRAIVMHLLNRMRDFNEWGQCTVLEVVAKYLPESPQEVFDIMNVLEDRLKHSNSAVVLGAVKVFLNLTHDMPQVNKEVYKRIKVPLITLMSSPVFEISYAVLSHVSLLVTRAPDVFADQYKHYFCRYNDPSSVKQLKLSTLTELAVEENTIDILTELAEYVTDVDSSIAKLAIRGIGKLAIKREACVDEATAHLLSFLELQMDYVTAETCVVVKDLLRKYPERHEEVLPTLERYLRAVDEPEGRAAVIWIIGEYGESVAEAPYILEPWIDLFADEPSNSVRMELLSASMKLFFKRPPETHKMLGRLLAAAAKDLSVDVRDRASMYYRLLKHDIHEAARVVNCPKIIVDSFAELEDQATKDKIFDEFNSLSVIYGLPSDRFMPPPEVVEDPHDHLDDALDATPAAAPAAVPSGPMDEPVSADPASSAALGAGGAGDMVDLLDDFMMGGMSAGPPASSAPVPIFQASPVCQPQVFRQKWPSAQLVAQFDAQLVSPDAALRIQPALESANLATMASGKQGTLLKLYMFGQLTDGALVMMELNADLSTSAVQVTLKADAATQLPVSQALSKALESLVR